MHAENPKAAEFLSTKHILCMRQIYCPCSSVLMFRRGHFKQGGHILRDTATRLWVAVEVVRLRKAQAFCLVSRWPNGLKLCVRMNRTTERPQSFSGKLLGEVLVMRANSSLSSLECDLAVGLSFR